MCRNYYIHPCVLDAYVGGTLLDTLQNGTKSDPKTDLSADEAAVAWLLRQQLGIDSASQMIPPTK